MNNSKNKLNNKKKFDFLSNAKRTQKLCLFIYYLFIL